MQRFSCSLLAAVAALVGARGVAQAQTVASALSNFNTDVRNYNLISLGNVTLNGVSDTQMGLAIKGSLTITNNSTGIAQDGTLSGGTYGLTGDPTLYVAGALSIGSGETVKLGSGYAALPGSTGWTYDQTGENLTKSGGTFNWTNANSTSSYDSSNPISNPIPTGWNWNTITNDAKNDSNTLANAATNGTSVIAGTISVDAGQNLVFSSGTVANGSTVIFTLNANLLGTSANTYNGTSFSNIEFNETNTDANYVVNVINGSGKTIFQSGTNMSNPSVADELLWNVTGTGTVTLGGNNFYGSVLAPTATIQNASNTYITGQVLAGAFNETGAELHYDPFANMAIGGIVPEPATFAIFAVGLCGLAIVARKKLVG